MNFIRFPSLSGAGAGSGHGARQLGGGRPPPTGPPHPPGSAWTHRAGPT